MVTRRQVLKGAGATGAAAATGATGWWAVSGAEFLPGTNEEEIEGQASAFRGNIEDIDEELDGAIEDVSVPTDTEEYEGRGVQLTDKFNVAVPEDKQSFHIPREVDGDSVLYTWQEGTDSVGLDETWERVRSQVGLGSEDAGVIEDVRDDLGGAVLYTATTEEGQPAFNDEDIAELEGLHEELTGEFNEVVEYLDQLGNEITNVRALDTELRTSEYQKSHKLPLVGEVWGESYDESQITKDEVNALRNGEEPYEGIGLEDSLDMAQEEYRSAARQAAKVGLVKELVGQTVADAKDQLDQYGAPEEDEPVDEPDDLLDEPPEECGVTDEEYADVLDADPGNVSYRESGDDRYDVLVNGEKEETLVCD